MKPEKLVRAAFRAILRREPSDKEVTVLRLSLLAGPDAHFHFLRTMIDSEEFKKQILPGLVSETTHLLANPVFFLHIPKTGGTSMRELIGELLGVPSINLYKAWSSPSKEGHRFWPYWAGHAQVSCFPPEHKGITFFRDTKSRLLSQYRQQMTFTGGTKRTHGWNYPNAADRRVREKKAVPFSIWIESFYATGRGSVDVYLAENKSLSGLRRTPNEVQQLFRTDESDLKSLLKSGLSRFTSAAWIHKEADVRDAIKAVTGQEVASLPRKNTYKAKSLAAPKVPLTAADLKILDYLEKRDDLAFEIAEDLGLVNRLPREEREKLFEKSAKRLDFEL